MTPADEVPLHSMELPAGWVYACRLTHKHQNRTYDWRCVGCIDVAETDVVTYGNPTVAWDPSAQGHGPLEDRSMSWLVARARYWQGRNDGIEAWSGMER